MNTVELLEWDRRHIWHPYTSATQPQPVAPVASAAGAILTLEDGTELIDGMSSWWSAIHGYNHPRLNAAATDQLARMSHVMFGGLTHRPAVELAQKLVEITPAPLQRIFLADSGSVSVEVAMKMAVQYYKAQGVSHKTRFITLKKGYHGDTTGAMSLCDPENGMHRLFNGVIQKQHAIEAPVTPYSGEELCPADEKELEQAFQNYAEESAAFVLEPVVQGAGGMNMYSPAYVKRVRELCSAHGILMIADEIATGFGRTGKLFGCSHADVSPDIMCVGKSLTGGYMTLAATLATDTVAETISADGGVLMHGPTFMANPLACAVALESIRLLEESPWQENIARMHRIMHEQLAPLKTHALVRDTRFLGAIAVVELREPVDPVAVQERFIDAGIWVRPFGRLVYLMPPYIISSGELESLCTKLAEILQNG
ncbi:MAG: adenosylmethionine--8-amino-7-oxononanoate transaminase [Fibrobacterota bacterium]